jgi:hypothetical protein
MAREWHGRRERPRSCLAATAPQFGTRVRPVLGDHRFVGKPRMRRGSWVPRWVMSHLSTIPLGPHPSGNQPTYPGGSELIFLGRYRLTSSPPPPGFPQSCPSRETSTSPLCRFEVIVRDTNGDLTGSKGDFFSIKLSSSTAVTSALDPLTVFYARAGYLEGGNLKVK